MLRIIFDNPTFLSAVMTRARKPTSDLIGGFRIVLGPDGKEQWSGPTIAASDRRGKLRFVRSGSQLHFFSPDGAGEFQEFGKVEVGTGDVKTLRAVCTSGWKPVATDVRLTELTIDADQFPDGMASTPPATASSEDAPKTEGSTWVLVAEVLGLLFLLALVAAGAWWLYTLHRRRAAVLPSPLPAVEDAPVVHVVSFPCPECGKNLRAKSELAGRKVKCTQCACAVVVPANRRRTPPHGVVRSS
jgi:hypothetical protein